jgi:type I restriction enzyme R subunit
VNTLFEGELSPQDKLVYVNDVIMGKLLESDTLVQQAANNTKEQFASSPDLQHELTSAIISALDAHTLMSTQALNSDVVRAGILDILLNHAQLHEALRKRAAG